MVSISDTAKKIGGGFLIILAIILFIVAPVQREKDPDNMTYGGMVTLVIIGVICFIIGVLLINNSNMPHLTEQQIIRKAQAQQKNNRYRRQLLAITNPITPGNL